MTILNIKWINQAKIAIQVKFISKIKNAIIIDSIFLFFINYFQIFTYDKIKFK